MLTHWIDGLGETLVAECDGTVVRIAIRRASVARGEPVAIDAEHPEHVAFGTSPFGPGLRAYATEYEVEEGVGLALSELELWAFYPARKHGRHPRGLRVDVEADVEWTLNWEPLDEPATVGKGGAR